MAVNYRITRVALTVIFIGMTLKVPGIKLAPLWMRYLISIMSNEGFN